MPFMSRAFCARSRKRRLWTGEDDTFQARADRQEIGRWANNRAENSHQPFRRRERAMLRFRRMKTLQRFASTHATFHNHFQSERHLVSREIYRERRSAALAEWRQVAS